MNLNELINEKVMQVCKVQAQEIEKACQNVIDMYKCRPDQLIINYQVIPKISIDIRAWDICINNIFVIRKEEH